MQRTKTLLGVIAGAAALLISAGVTTTAAAPADVPAGVPTITTLPLLGVPLTVEVTTGPGGALTNVAINPADGFTATTLKPNRVVFENLDGTGKVSVGDGHGRQSVSARAGSLADVSGQGGWSGDVFGTGTATTVAFTIGATADGTPDITDVSTDDPTAVIAPTAYGTHEDDDDDDELEAWAAAKITFSTAGQTRTLTISVRVHTDDDGTTSASSRVTLGRIHGAVLPVEQATGEKTWQGQLCNGDAYSVTYLVADDGTVTFVSSNPTDAELRDNEGKGGFQLRFADGERVRVHGHLADDGIRVDVTEKIRCRDAADPTVNTPIELTPTTVDHDDDDDDDDDDHGDRPDHDDDDDDDDDDDHDGSRRGKRD